jgi:hypothetical protein
LIVSLRRINPFPHLNTSEEQNRMCKIGRKAAGL